MTLYEIKAELSKILDEGYEAFVDPETGEFDEEGFNNSIAELEQARDEKIENIALFIKNLEAEKDAIRNEEKALAERRKVKENKIESLKNYLSQDLTAHEQDKFETAKCRLSFRKSEKVVADETLLDKKWMTEKIEYSPDKKAIKEAIKGGEVVPGAFIEVNQNIQIK